LRHPDFFTKTALIFLAACIAASGISGPLLAKETVLHSFEKDPDGWEIPDWALEKGDHVATHIAVSQARATEGKASLEVAANFLPDKGWEGAYVERVADITDWSPFRYFSADVFLPAEAPRGLRARIILTVGEGWKWAEMNKTIPLTPGEWTVVKADMTPDSRDWRRFITDDFRADVRKIGIRIESNGKVSYKGPIYIDNVRLSD
jgi:hypothetical protein